MIHELLRTLAYVAAQECQDTVNYVTLQSDMMNTRAKSSVLQELGMQIGLWPLGLHTFFALITAGRDIHSYIERTATKLVHNKQSQNDTCT